MCDCPDCAGEIGHSLRIDSCCLSVCDQQSSFLVTIETLGRRRSHSSSIPKHRLQESFRRQSEHKPVKNNIPCNEDRDGSAGPVQLGGKKLSDMLGRTPCRIPVGCMCVQGRNPEV